jgi:hypothetical protein
MSTPLAVAIVGRSNSKLFRPDPEGDGLPGATHQSFEQRDPSSIGRWPVTPTQGISFSARTSSYLDPPKHLACSPPILDTD